jgi:hypothetical protein
MKLSELLKLAQEIFDKYGDIDVIVDDVELGTTQPILNLGKVLAYQAGDEESFIPERMIHEQPSLEEQLKCAEDQWNPEKDLASWASKEEYMSCIKQHIEARQDFLKRYAEAPYTLAL